MPPSAQPVSSVPTPDLRPITVVAEPIGDRPRNAAIDHLRILLTCLVIFHHVAIAYGGSGGWYWREQADSSQPLLLIFNATNQSFFMGFFFLLAGYYTPASYERKGPRRFWAERLLRLGVPLLFYFFILSPLTFALGRTEEGQSLWLGWWETRSGAFGPGPLWFAEALLLFAAGYSFWRRWRPAPGRAKDLPTFGVLAITAVILGAVSFFVRLAIPVGKEFAWLQLGYFPCYIYLFIAGSVAARGQVLERITFRQALPWLTVALLAWSTLPVLVFGRPWWQGSFDGGWNGNALYYALWDPLVGWGAILGLLWAARTYGSRATPLTAWLAGNAFAAYIVHPPVTVVFSLAARTWPFSPLGKFALVGAASCAGSFLIAAALRIIPGARRIL